RSLMMISTEKRSSTGTAAAPKAQRALGYQRILVPMDGSAEAMEILTHVATLAKAFSSHVTLVESLPSAEMLMGQVAAGMGAEPPIIVDPTPIIDSEREEADSYLKQAARRLRAE